MTEDAAAAAAIDKGVTIEETPDDVLEEDVMEKSVLEERCMS